MIHLTSPFARLVSPVLCAAIGMFSLAGCAFHDDEAPVASSDADMTLEVNYSEKMHRCSRVSPELIVQNIPANTDYFVVRLIEEGTEERFFGGGEWNNDGSGLIPEGGLTQHYQGPCPPAGQERTYAYIVSAMQKKNPQPLKVRLARVTPEVR